MILQAYASPAKPNQVSPSLDHMARAVGQIETQNGDQTRAGTAASEELAIDLSSGKILWQRTMPASVTAAPTVVGAALIQPTASGDLITLDKRSGKIVNICNCHEGGHGPQNAGSLQAIPLGKLAVHD